MAKKDKKVRIGVSPSPSKKPLAEPVPDFNKLHPAWRVSRLEMCDPFGWHEIEKAKLEDIRLRLVQLEKLTWKEILIDQNHWNHTVSRSSLCKKAQDRLADLSLDDQEYLISLRLSNSERIWGFKMDGAMTLLWWDPTHDVWGDKN